MSGRPAAPARRLYFARVWLRNWTVYRRTWLVNFAPPLLEPFLFLFAFGFGVGRLVDEVIYRGTVMPYPVFIAPGIIAVAVLNHSFFETTYASFVRMYYQRTFEAILATPLQTGDIIAGEIAWAATKGVFSALIMLAVISLFIPLAWPAALLVLPLAVLGGLLFAALGMLCTAITRHIDQFNFPVFLLVTPMFLFSGVFFPLESLPGWARLLAEMLPLTHLVLVMRQASLGHFDSAFVPALMRLAGLALLLLPTAGRLMRRRLVR